MTLVAREFLLLRPISRIIKSLTMNYTGSGTDDLMFLETMSGLRSLINFEITFFR